VVPLTTTSNFTGQHALFSVMHIRHAPTYHLFSIYIYGQLGLLYVLIRLVYLMYQCYLTSVEKLLTYVDLYTPKSLRRTVLIYFGDIVMYICWGRARASAPKRARSKSMSNSYVSLFYLDILIPCKISPPKISN
jgi:hypothetical protein